MASLLWGKVYYKTHFAGFIREEPGNSISFTYDPSYLANNNLPIAQTLPLRPEPFVSIAGLLPFFDNLVAEGWLETAQKRLLGKRITSRFELLLTFGYDCAGAVSVLDPEPLKLTQSHIDTSDPKELAVLTGRASLSGIQPKIALVERGGKFYPAKVGELSTYIAKFPSSHHADLTMNEYVTMQAFQTLLPEDDVVELQLGQIEGFQEEALIIKRFDRTMDGQRIHFEEFNQLLGYLSAAKYDGSYKDMANFINTMPGCLNIESYRLFLRVLAGILLGNTDMHLKNFAMMYRGSELRLTPSYDQVAAILYGYKSMALEIAGARDLPVGNIKPTTIIRLGKEFQLSDESIHMAYEQLAQNISNAKDKIRDMDRVSPLLKDNIINLLEKRWNGTFALIGKHLSQKP